MDDREPLSIAESDEMQRQQFEMTKKTHDFMFAAPPGKKCRAERLDTILDAWLAGKLGVRAVFFVSGLVAAIGGAWLSLREMWPR